MISESQSKANFLNGQVCLLYDGNHSIRVRNTLRNNLTNDECIAIDKYTHLTYQYSGYSHFGNILLSEQY